MIRRRSVLAGGGACLALAAQQSPIRAAAGPRARFFMVVGGGPDGPAAQSWNVLVSELQKRGYPTTPVPSILTDRPGQARIHREI